MFRWQYPNNSTRLFLPLSSFCKLLASGYGVGAVITSNFACSDERSFSIIFCNICCVILIFHFVSPQLWFLSETQLLEHSNGKLFSVPSYCFYSHFSAKVRVEHVCSIVSFVIMFLMSSVPNFQPCN